MASISIRKLSYAIFDNDIIVSGDSADVSRDDYFGKDDFLWDIVIDVNTIDSLVQENMRFIAKNCLNITDLTLKISRSPGPEAFSNAVDALFENPMSVLRTITIDLGFNDTDGAIIRKIQSVPSLRCLRVNIKGAIYYRNANKNLWKLHLDELDTFEIFSGDSVSLVREKLFFASWSMRNLGQLVIRKMLITDDMIPFVKRNGFSIRTLDLSTHHFRFQDFLDSSPYLENLTLDVQFSLPTTLQHARLNVCCFRSVGKMVRSSLQEWGRVLATITSFAEKKQFPMIHTIRLLDSDVNLLVVDKLFKRRCKEIIGFCESKKIKVVDENGRRITSALLRGPALSKVKGMGSFSLHK